MHFAFWDVVFGFQYVQLDILTLHGWIWKNAPDLCILKLKSVLWLKPASGCKKVEILCSGLFYPFIHELVGPHLIHFDDATVSDPEPV